MIAESPDPRPKKKIFPRKTAEPQRNGEDGFSAMVLAAGFGARLRPLTDHIPKPLAPICGMPLLSIITEKILSAGAQDIVVNLHHMPEKIIAHAPQSRRAKLRFVKEREILGAGGAILNCKKFLSHRNFFLLHNADIISDADLPSLIAHHKKSGMAGTLLLVNGHDNKISTVSGKITGIKNLCGTCENRNLLTYTGIAVFNKSAFDFFPKEVRPFPLTEILKKIIAAGALGALAPQNIYWNDIGSIEKYFSVHEDILLKKIFSPKWLNEADKPFPTQLKKNRASHSLKGFLSVNANCEIRKGATIENCILLNRAIVKENEFRKNEIIGRGFSIHRDSASIMPLEIMRNCDFRKASISSLPEQGSNRRFYRIRESKKNRILMLSSDDDADFPRFIRLGIYFERLGLCAPKIFSHSMKSRSALMEDLGGLTLNKAISDPKQRLAILKKTIRFLTLFQNISIHSATKKVQREFGFNGLRWESKYFSDNFLAKFAKIKISALPGIENEFDQIAKNALSSPQVLCHRDFQSQNIILRGGKIRIVDFQGSRIGPLAYDLMSLLRDAYTHIPETEINKLMKYYFNALSQSRLGKKLRLAYANFAKFASSAAVQRNMQALGAFAFLGLAKGKKSYLNHIGRGLFNLRKSLEAYKSSHGAESVPQLSKALENIRLNPPRN